MWECVANASSIVGLALTLYLLCKTRNIDKQIKELFSERSFAKRRPEFIKELIAHRPYLFSDDRNNISSAIQEVDSILSNILAHDPSLNSTQKRQIEKIRAWNEPSFENKLAAYNDVIAALQKEEAIYNEQKLK